MQSKELPMTVGIDASRAFSSDRTGTENYSYQIISELVKNRSDLLYRLYLRPSSCGSGLTGLAQERPIQLRRFWTQVGLAFETWKSPVDLLFIPAHVVPVLKNYKVPVVLTVHDLRTEFLPQHSSMIQKVYLNKYTEMLRARLATHVIAVSRATKSDVIRLLKVPEDKVTVIHEGVDRERFSHKIKSDGNKIAEIRKKYQLNKDYILYVGTIQPRKNLVRLIEAFSHLNRDIELVLAGKKGWLSEEIYQAPEKYGVRQQVRFLDYVSDEDLPYLYAMAVLFALPSLYEGFGLPILESFAVGTPVVTSNISSMPEVGGGFAVYVDPNSVESIEEGLIKGLSHRIDKQEMSAYLDRFSWREAAVKTEKVFRKVLAR